MKDCCLICTHLGQKKHGRLRNCKVRSENHKSMLNMAPFEPEVFIQKHEIETCWVPVEHHCGLFEKK